MSVKELRKKANLTQKDFAIRFRIPLQTLKQWESNVDSTSYRKPPEYVEYLLERLVAQESGMIGAKQMLRVERIIDAAKDSRYDARHWFRCLRKEIADGREPLSRRQIECVLNSEELTMFQKISFARVMEKDSVTYAYVDALNRPVKTKMFDEIMRKHGYEQK